MGPVLHGAGILAPDVLWDELDVAHGGADVSVSHQLLQGRSKRALTTLEISVFALMPTASSRIPLSNLNTAISTRVTVPFRSRADCPRARVDAIALGFIEAR